MIHAFLTETAERVESFRTSSSPHAHGGYRIGSDQGSDRELSALGL
jgi:hypothetical protein